jgi:flagellar motor component MotA
MKRFKQFFLENSTEDAKKTLEAIIATLKKSEGDDSKEMLDFAKGIMDYYKKEGSFSNKQALWIFNTSKSMFK